jgi:predicted transglutaminase-like cysteine proteinase
MFSRVVAVRSIAALLVLLPSVIGGVGTVFAQDRTNYSATEPTEPSSRAPAAIEPFGLSAVPVTSGDVLNKWNGLLADIRAENDVLARCRDHAHCPAAAQKFLAVIADGRARDGRGRIGVINRAINLAIQPMSDLAQWGVPDRWSAPLETLTTGRGDCEDYAIAKYVALREAGVAEDDLRLIIVRDLGIAQDHAVVAARLDDKWIVLDNRRLTLVEANDMQRVQPLFALDHGGVKQFVPAAAPAMMADARAAVPGEGATTAPSALDLQISPE